MSFVSRTLGYVSMVANLGLALFLLGLGIIGSAVGGDMKIDLIPVSPESMATTLMLSGIAALVCVALALRPGKPSRLPLVLWSLLVSALLICAFARSSYRFDGIEHFRTGVWVFLVSLVVLAGAFLRMKASAKASSKTSGK